jgi:ABC-type transport system involved in multi-copper enzyme maturation permease subunit
MNQTASATPSSNLYLFRVLFYKEWMRLKRNPSALMAVGLLILMAFLVNIETQPKDQRLSNANRACRVVYSIEDDFIRHLKANQHPKLLVKFLKVEVRLDGSSYVDYASGINCVAEISELVTKAGKPTRRITFRNSQSDLKKISGLSRWLLSGLAAHHSGMNIQQSMQPITSNQANPSSKPFDLTNGKSKAMVSAMLVFSTQFFICCALFISLTASERERGILQALALTPASPKQLLFAKVAFHLALSLVASYIIISILKTNWFSLPVAWLFITPVLLFSSLGLIAVASFIVSFNKTQTSASLMGFCYLMLVGVVFALSQNFAGFAIVKQLMFEHHVISLYGILFDGTSLTRQEATASGLMILVHIGALLLIIPSLMAISFFVWRRKGWRQS